MRRSRAIAIVGVTAVVAVVATTLPILAGEQADAPITLHPAADTTVTQIAQDGDNSVKTTLATCPQACEGNANGLRDAVLEFAVAGVPAGATVTATLRLYSWNPYAARISAHVASGGAGGTGHDPLPAIGPSLSTNASVVAGYNDLDVSSAVTGNGTVTFLVDQSGYANRVYWASHENSNTAIQPELVLTYTAAPAWHEVWSDEFSGTAIDSTKWNLRAEGRDVDHGCNTTSPANQFESGGLLTVRALRQTATCAGGQRQYTEGYLDTIGKASWTYGRFEMRAKSPNGPTNSQGLWPAFWLRPNDGGNGEIDVVELPGGASYYKAATQAIFHDYNGTKQDQRWSFPGSTYAGDGFHTYVTEWDASALRWYLDGTLVYTRDRTTTSWYDEVFDKPYNLRLNFQVGGWLGEPTTATTFPADFQVDYIRVYQH